jgi:sugar phosphate isomerase/epimerase
MKGVHEMASISLAGWSIHRRFLRQDGERLLLTDFARLSRSEFGIDTVELNSPFFASLDDAYIAELRTIADGEGVAMLNIAIDGQGDLSSEDTATRAQAVEAHARWFSVAAALGCNAVRANTGGQGGADADILPRCTESFAKLAELGRPHGVAIMIENHGGLSADPDNVVRIMDDVADNIGTLPDFGNVAPEIRYEAMEKLAPYAIAVHAKTHEFGEDGEDLNIDIGRCVRIVKDAGYDGSFGIEFEGAGSDHEGVLKTKALLERYL